jgi:hypothetical protein
VIVIDASLAFELSIATKQGESLGARLANESKPLIAPEVIELESLKPCGAIFGAERSIAIGPLAPCETSRTWKSSAARPRLGLARKLDRL